MKGIYLTEEAKKEIEAMIAELSGYNDEPETTQLKVYKEILSSSTILPVEESYNDIQHFETSEHGTVIRKHFLMANYPNGLIIQPK